MRFYKQVKDGYIISVGVGYGFIEITEKEYNDILNMIQYKPASTKTVDYRLKEDMSWEACEIEPEPASDDIDDSEALSILLGE